MDSVDDNVRRVIEQLRQHVRLSPLARGEIAKRLGHSRSHIYRLLAENRKLSLRQLFELLEVLELDPFEFFMNVFGMTRPPALPPVRAARFDQTRDPRSTPEPLLPPALSIDDFELMVDEAVRRALAKAAAAPPTPDSPEKKP